MKLADVRRFEMLARVRDFGAAHPDLFPATSLGGELFAAVNGVVDDVNGFGVASATGDNSARGQTVAKTRARGALHAAMLALCRTARAAAAEIPGLEAKFRMPRTRVDQRSIPLARAMAQEATPYVDRLVAHGLAPTFPADLTAAADAFATTIQDHAAATEARASATMGIAKAIAKGIAVARRLDTIVKNQLAGNPQLLAAWRAARHISQLGLTYPPAAPQTPPLAPQPA